MLDHAVHATATFAELGMAVSLGLMMKIIKPAENPNDAILRETKKRQKEQDKADKRNKTIAGIQETDGPTVAFLHRVVCKIKDGFNKALGWIHFAVEWIWDKFHYFTAALALLALIGLAYCNEQESWTFFFALASLLLATWKAVYVHRSTEFPREQKDGMLGVPVDPVPP